MTAATPHGLARGIWEPKADVLELENRHIHARIPARENSSQLLRLPIEEEPCEIPRPVESRELPENKLRAIARPCINSENEFAIRLGTLSSSTYDTEGSPSGPHSE